MDKQKRHNVMFSDKEWEDLSRAAEQLGVSLSWIIRSAVAFAFKHPNDFANYIVELLTHKDKAPLTIWTVKEN